MASGARAMVIASKAATPAWVRRASRVAGLLAGPVMLAIFLHLLLNAVVPLTATGGWRGPADVIAVLSYLAGGVPMLVISLLEAELLGRDETGRLRLHVAMVAVFLVVAHVAMIFGMLDPAVMGYSPKAPASVQHDMGSMSGMNHDMGGMTDMDHSTMMPSSAPSK